MKSVRLYSFFKGKNILEKGKELLYDIKIGMLFYLIEKS